MKVLLVSANTLIMPYPVYPLGLDYVAGALDSTYQTKIVDLNELENLDQLVALIKNFSPDVVGLSIRNIDNTDTINSLDFFSEYQNITRLIKENSKALLILGGSGFTVFPVEFLQALDADYGVVGEGERLSVLLEALRNGQDVKSIPCIITKETNEVNYRPWDKEICRKFDATSSHTKFYLSHGGMLNIQTKRGCPFRCSYCTYPYIEGSKMRFSSPQEIAQQARELQDAGAKYIFITDASFNASYEHSSKVAQAFIDAHLSIPWGGFFAPTSAPADYYKHLADAGLTHVEFGTESLSDKILNNFRKPFVSQDVFRVHRQALNAGLYIAHYFLLGGPGENSKTLQETLKGVDKLEESVFFFFCGIRIYPHTALYEFALKEKQLEPLQSLLHPVFYRSPAISDVEIMQRVEKHANGRFNWMIGAGESKATRVLPRLYKRGFTGPLWEHLIQ